MTRCCMLVLALGGCLACLHFSAGPATGQTDYLGFPTTSAHTSLPRQAAAFGTETDYDREPGKDWTGSSRIPGEPQAGRQPGGMVVSALERAPLPNRTESIAPVSFALSTLDASESPKQEKPDARKDFPTTRWYGSGQEWSHTKTSSYAAMLQAGAKVVPPDVRIAGGGWPQPYPTCSPCSTCTLPRQWCRFPGFNGHPYNDCPGCGVTCGHPCLRLKMPNFSPHWPRPFHNKECYIAPGCEVPHQMRDQFDFLAKIKIANFTRKDNGYVGRNCDPFGILGESARGIRVAEKVTSVTPHRDYFKQDASGGGAGDPSRAGEGPAPAAPQGMNPVEPLPTQLQNHKLPAPKNGEF